MDTQEPIVSTEEKRKAWIEACRLRTLPLAVSGSIVAAGIALCQGVFRLPIFILMFVCSILLQTIANFADDWGDLKNGLDDETRVGPHRGLQRGVISMVEMKRALIGICVLTLVVGLALVGVAFFAGGPTMTQGAWAAVCIFVVLGVAAIAAALFYTMGKHPYGYIGLGDLASFLFFGIVAVVGGCFLYAHQFTIVSLVAGIALGLPVVGVINVNNMRDSARDAAKGKRTVANMLGDPGMRIYQSVLLSVSAILFVVTLVLCGAVHIFGYCILVIAYGMWLGCLMALWKIPDPEKFDRLMAPTSMGTVVVCLAWFIAAVFIA